MIEKRRTAAIDRILLISILSLTNTSSTTVPSSLSAGTQGKWDAFPPHNVYKCLYGRRNVENEETEENNIM